MESNSRSRLASFLENPQKALWTLAIPIMFGMGIHTLYNIVDMLFIGRLGGDAIAGVAFNMPIFFLCTHFTHYFIPCGKVNLSAWFTVQLIS